MVSVEPADGSRSATAPSSFSLTFNEPTSPLVLRLVHPDGQTTTLTHFVLRDATVVIDAPTGLANGTYALSWRVVSEDGHPVGGSSVFSIGNASASAVHPADAVSQPLRAAIWSGKIVIYAALFVGVGGVFFTKWVAGPTSLAPHAVRWVLVAGLIAQPLALGFRGLDALGSTFEALGTGLVWRTGFSTTYSATVLVAALAIASALVAVPLTGAGAKVLSLVGRAAVGVALAASGHASAAQPQWLTRPAVFAHGVGIASWVGSLIPLARALATPSPDSVAILRRFSRTIPFSVLLLIVAGIVLAVIQLRSVSALLTTAYGQVLCIKLGLLVVLFGIAAVNRYQLTVPAERGEASAHSELRQSIAVELLLIFLIFAVAAAWRFTPPPRSFVEVAAPAVTSHIHTDKAIIEIKFDPGRSGPTRVTLSIMGGDMSPLDPKEVTLVLANPASGIEPIRRRAVRSGEGNGQVDGVNLPVGGRWSVQVDMLISDFELLKVAGYVEIPR